MLVCFGGRFWSMIIDSIWYYLIWFDLLTIAPVILLEVLFFFLNGNNETLFEQKR
ncbi:hypothetical protein Hanom_Chr03g00277381 [Helianthus anomalus]